MKALLVGEYREGKILASTYETVAFAQKLGADAAMFLVGDDGDLPKFDGPLYLADARKYSEFNPVAHKRLLLQVVEKEKPDLIVFAHSSYGWDLAPRVALAVGSAQVSEVVDILEGAFVVPACNAKLRRNLRAKNGSTVVTLQAGAFGLPGEPAGSPIVKKIEADADGPMEFLGYEAGEKKGIDLTKAEIIVSAGRGIGKKENMEVITTLANALNGEIGASRPVVDSGWVEPFRQIGTTGQTVGPKLYIACGISGAIQHLAGMRQSNFIVAINKDKEAPIGEIADVLVVADVMQFANALVESLRR